MSKVKRQSTGKIFVTHIAGKGLTGLQGDLELCFGHVSLEVTIRPSNREADQAVFRGESTKEIYLAQGTS